MARSKWPLSILGFTVSLVLAANSAAQNPLNSQAPMSRGPGFGGPSLGAPGDDGGLAPVDDEPELAPVDAANRGSRSGQGNREPAGNAAPRRRSGKQAPVLHAPAEGYGGMRQDPNARRVSAQSSPAGVSAQSLLTQAYKRSVTATEEADYTETIELCRDAMQAGVKGNSATYLRRLMAWAYNKRGECLSSAGKDTPAFEDFQAAVELDNTSWRALHNRGVSLAGMGKTAEAAEDFSRAVEINRDFSLAYFNRGEMRYEQGDFNGAIEDYNTASKNMANDPNLYNSRGHAQYRLRRFKEAIIDFNIALRLDPHNAAALVNRGDVHADTAYYAEAAADYKAAIQFDPKLGRAFQSVAWLMATCPDKQYRNGGMAIEAAERALAIDGRGDYRYLATLAAAQATAGKFDDAIRTQQEAIDAAPETSRATQEKRLALYEARKPFHMAQRDSQGRTGGQIRNAPKQQLR